MKATALLAAVGTLALAGSAFANDTRIYSGEGGPLPGGTGGITSRFEIFVPGTPGDPNSIIKDFKEVILHGLNQTFAGDLLIVLTHKDTGTQVVLLDRPGVPESTFGDGADFVGDYSFQDGGFVYDADVFGLTVDEHVLGPVSGSLSAFVGESKVGIWSLTITDFDAADNGTLQGWSIVLNNVPAPGALALLGVAGLTARRRRSS